MLRIPDILDWTSYLKNRKLDSGDTKHILDFTCQCHKRWLMVTITCGTPVWVFPQGSPWKSHAERAWTPCTKIILVLPCGTVCDYVLHYFSDDDCYTVTWSQQFHSCWCQRFWRCSPKKFLHFRWRRRRRVTAWIFFKLLLVGNKISGQRCEKCQKIPTL